MVDKRVFVILLLLATYILVVKPTDDKLRYRLVQLKNIEKEIAKEKFVEKESVRIKKIYPRQMEIAKRNLMYFFPYNMRTSTAMSSMQSVIKKAARLHALKVLSMNWGAAEDAGKYMRLPISFRMEGYPDGVAGFIKDILTQKKLMRFDMYSASSNGKKLTISGVIVAYRLKKGALK
ncbi:hypothetical protein [Persephonella sp.]